MKRVEMTDQEAKVLSDVLQSDLSDLRMEIADTEDQPFREELKQTEVLLRSLIGRLGTGEES